MTKQAERVATNDGSFTLKHVVFNEHYHSIHGALQESRHVFMDKGLALFPNKKELYVFEMGLGTGLNALLAHQFAQEHKVLIHYYSIEAYPITLEEAKALAYEKHGLSESIFQEIHTCSWNEKHALTEYFHFHKIQGFLESTPLDFLPAINVIFYDAFAPSAQEYLWEIPILDKMKNILGEGGLLSTYCAKGQFKRNLKSVGFRVEAAAGPPGKREMTLAWA
jgi:tRNA U34 5-methylaminomethyl-2-thiouridine-forming methyltransferase MnmC